GNLYIKGSVVDLNGYSLTVRGNLIQSRGTVKINGGQLIVEGDYRLQSENVSGDGTVTYSASSGKLEMIDEEDYVLVNGDFAIQSSYKHTDYLKAGILEVKGDFTQKRNSTYSDSAYNFNANTYHKVVLSGNGIQNINFQNPGSSRFNHLIITKPLEYGYIFNTTKNIWNSIEEDFTYSTRRAGTTNKIAV